MKKPKKRDFERDGEWSGEVDIIRNETIEEYDQWILEELGKIAKTSWSVISHSDFLNDDVIRAKQLDTLIQKVKEENEI